MDFWRKNIRLPRGSYIGHQWYFLTACTQDRIPRLQDDALVGQHLDLLTDRAKEKCFDIQAYCFMPDHLHLLMSGNTRNLRLFDIHQWLQATIRLCVQAIHGKKAVATQTL